MSGRFFGALLRGLDDAEDKYFRQLKRIDGTASAESTDHFVALSSTLSPCSKQ